MITFHYENGVKREFENHGESLPCYDCEKDGFDEMYIARDGFERCLPCHEEAMQVQKEKSKND